MSKVQVNSQIELDLEDILNGIALLDLSELEQFTSKVYAINANRHVQSLSRPESELLMKINLGVSEDLRERYHELNQKLHEDEVSDSEHKELLEIIDQIEQSDAERIHAMIELSEVRNMPLDALRVELGIDQPAYASRIHLIRKTPNQVNRIGLVNIRTALLIIRKHPLGIDE